MARGTSRRTAIVADRRPLERGLARFLLEERGVFVVGEAATMADVLLQIQQLKPDFVVLHEKLALDLGADAFMLKPAEPDVFLAQLERILARAAPGQLPAAAPAVIASGLSEMTCLPLAIAAALTG